MQLVLNTPGMALKVRNGAFEAIAGEERRLISAQQLEGIAITAGCLISTAAIELAVKYDLSIYLFDEVGDAVGCLRSPYFESIATLRRKQVYFGDALEGGAWIVNLFRQKTENQLKNLAYLADRRPSMLAPLQKTVQQMEAELTQLDALTGQTAEQHGATLMGWEGSLARKYWAAVSQCLPEPWSFAKRSRRPAEDPFNAALNYHYGMLYTIVEQALFAAGLDPHLGILHADEYDQPTLAFDLIEPFRPWVDQLLCSHFIKGEVQLEFFEKRNEGWYLNSAGKRFFIPAFNAWLDEPVRWQNRQMSRRAHMYRAAAELAKTINDFERPISPSVSDQTSKT